MQIILILSSLSSHIDQHIFSAQNNFSAAERLLWSRLIAQGKAINMQTQQTLNMQFFAPWWCFHDILLLSTIIPSGHHSRLRDQKEPRQETGHGEQKTSHLCVRVKWRYLQSIQAHPDKFTTTVSNIEHPDLWGDYDDAMPIQ